MKMKMLFGCFLTVTIMMTLPSINAANGSTAIDVLKSDMITSLENIKTLNKNQESLISKIITNLQKVDNIDENNFELLKNYQSKISKIDFASTNNYYLKLSLIFLLFGIIFLIEGNELASLYIMLSILYLLLYLI